jgi:hypothetical protein
MTDTFISYSRKDIAFAKIIHESLQSSQLETWIDWQDIPPSVDWFEEIKEAIEQADTFVFIISPTSVKSEICSKEIAHAELNNKRLIPIGVVRRVYSHFDLPWYKSNEAELQKFIQENPKNKHGKHQYTAADYGLVESEIADRFQFYTDYFGSSNF